MAQPNIPALSTQTPMPVSSDDHTGDAYTGSASNAGTFTQVSLLLSMC